MIDFGTHSILIFINDISKCTNQFKYKFYAYDSILSTCEPDDNVKDSSELVNSELKWLDKWLELIYN